MINSQFSLVIDPKQNSGTVAEDVLLAIDDHFASKTKSPFILGVLVNGTAQHAATIAAENASGDHLRLIEKSSNTPKLVDDILLRLFNQPVIDAAMKMIQSTSHAMSKNRVTFFKPAPNTGDDSELPMSIGFKM